MADVILYTKPWCPYCDSAKALLKAKGIAWTEIDVAKEPHRRQEMIEKANGRRTVPQVFVDGQGLGGYDDIFALDRQGKLDPILQIG